MSVVYDGIYAPDDYIEVEGPSQGKRKLLFGTQFEAIAPLYGAGTYELPSIAVRNVNTGIYSSATHTLDFTTAGLQRQSITPNGNILIGTTIETGLTGAGGLKIASTTLSGTGSGALVVAGGAAFGGGLTLTGANTITTSTGNLTLATGGASGHIILTPATGGNVGIGTTSPLSKLEVRGVYAALNGGLNASIFNIVSSNLSAVDTGATMQFNGESGNGSTPYGFAAIKGAKESAVADNYSGYLSLWTVPTGSGMIERVRVSGAGNLLIGTTSETGLTGAGGLKIASTTLSGTGAGALVVAGGAAFGGGLTLTGANTITTSTGNLTLSTSAGNGNINIIPHNQGMVGIGTGSPSGKLHVIAPDGTDITGFNFIFDNQDINSAHGKGMLVKGGASSAAVQIFEAQDFTGAAKVSIFGTGQLSVQTTTDSLSTTSGSIITAGGVGIGGKAFIGKSLDVSDSSAPSIRVGRAGTFSGDSASVILYGATSSSITLGYRDGTGNFVIANGASVGAGELVLIGRTSGQVSITAATDSATTATGSLITAGGIGIAKAAFVGTTLNVAGDVQFAKTVTTGGTTGAQTINKTMGTVNFAAAATSLVVTDSLVTANSIIVCTVGTVDTTMKSVVVVAAAGSFTITANAAATAETRVNFHVFN